MQTSLQRRQFLAAFTLGLPAAGLTPNDAGEEANAQFEWEEESILSGTFHEVPEGDAKPELFLTVILEELKRDEIIQSEDGPPVYRGRVLPYEAGNHPTMVEKFEFKWAGKPIPVPKNLWHDVGGVVMRRLKEKRPETPGAKLDSWDGADEHLHRPRLYKSADGGTALIEWDRPEE
jgi:hypothetical protein